MKYLLNAVAIAAALVIAAPAWAQNAPMTPSAPKAAAPAAMPAAPMQKHRAMRHNAMRHHAMRHHGRMMMKSGESMTQDLNRQELSRLQGGGAAAPMPQRPIPSASSHSPEAR